MVYGLDNSLYNILHYPSILIQAERLRRSASIFWWIPLIPVLTVDSQVTYNPYISTMI